jgi:hypothetical protein
MCGKIRILLLTPEEIATIISATEARYRASGAFFGRHPLLATLLKRIAFGGPQA